MFRHRHRHRLECCHARRAGYQACGGTAPQDISGTGPLTTVRANVTIAWTMRENVRAHLHVLVKRILRKNGYPPDKQDNEGLRLS
ncbi:MAG TPA: type I restriction enzyme endonuclease domain-containing protein [Rubrobacteraceae bacterium]|nr:type I restriction enzyme endonuclease domain-containing protein [Rubrobacteraceae bacterium]